MQKDFIFLIHGFMTDKASMFPLVEAFSAQGFPMHNAEFIGHDDATEADFMQSFWEDWFESVEAQFLKCAKENESIILIGHSMGGVLALALAQKYPQEVKALVTLASPLYINKLFPLEINNFSALFTPIFAPFYSKIRKDILSQWNIFKKKELTEQATEETYESSIKGLDDNCYYPPQTASLFKAMSKTRKKMSKVTQPLLVIHAYDDQTVAHSNADYILKKSNSKYKVLKKFTIIDDDSKKHQIVTHFDCKDQVFNEIILFLENINKFIV